MKILTTITAALFFITARAGLGLGGCPSYSTYGSYKNIPPGNYYLNYYDIVFWSLSNLVYQPMELTKSGRRYEDCTRSSVSLVNSALNMTFSAPFKGKQALNQSYLYTCDNFGHCADRVNKSYLNVIFVDKTKKIFATYYCLDIAEFASNFISAILSPFLPTPLPSELLYPIFN